MGAGCQCVAEIEGPRHHTIDKTAFLGSRFVGENIRLTKGIHCRTPSKTCLGEVRRNFLQRRSVLRAVGNHQVITLAGIVADGRGGIRHLEHILRELEGEISFAAHLSLNRFQGREHRLAERHIGGGAGHDHGPPELFGRRCGGRGRLAGREQQSEQQHRN